MNIFDEIEDLIEYLETVCEDADFVRAYNFSNTRRVLERPAVTFNGEVTQGDTATSTIIMKMYIPTGYSMETAENIFSIIFSSIKSKMSNVSAISREAVTKDSYGIIIGCNAVISGDGECSFLIGETVIEAVGVNISAQGSSYDVFTIGQTSPSVSLNALVMYIGEITSVNLEDVNIKESFDLTVDGYVYKNCIWTDIEYSSGSLAKTAKFQCSERVKED